ncbi:MAG: hypothetical protein JNM57_06875 [Cyclobacteriaceae bacterium]|nr:hypothetical protein [Cyclobacteriaceae bacterium]
MINYSSEGKMYTYLWSKYRPALLKLMIGSADSPQQYKFSNHEFKNINPKEKGGYSFTLKVFQGKAVNNIKASVVAQNLLEVLQQSKKASELLEASQYEFVMDKNFVLHIAKLNAVQEVVEPSVS